MGWMGSTQGTHRRDDIVPLYTYYCPKCGNKKDILVGISDADNQLCPQCDIKMDKVPTAPNFKLNGPGFYCNDY